MSRRFGYQPLRRGLVAVTMVVAAFAMVGQDPAQAAVLTHVSAAYNVSTSHFHGRVSSANAECVAHRAVRLYKETRSGPVLEGMTTSRAGGGWSTSVMNAHGKYFAVVPRQTKMGVACGRAVSNVVDVM